MTEAEEKTALRDKHDELICSLSHGYRQRVGVAQALVHKPKLLILDEPTSGLDPVQIVEMRSMIRALRGEHTILLSSHILSEISQTCDRLLVIQKGEIVAQGSEQELATKLGGGGTIEVEVAGAAQRAVDGRQDGAGRRPLPRSCARRAASRCCRLKARPTCGPRSRARWSKRDRPAAHRPRRGPPRVDLPQADQGAGRRGPHDHDGGDASPMNATFLIARRELGAYFRSMTGYVIAAAVLIIDGLLFNAFALGGPDKLSAEVLSLFFYFSSGTTIIASVFISMRLLAEERQTGTLVLLTSSPVQDWEIVLGKFLSAFGFLALITLATRVHAAADLRERQDLVRPHGGRLPGPAAAGQRDGGDRDVRLGAGAHAGAGGDLLGLHRGRADRLLDAGQGHRAAAQRRVRRAGAARQALPAVPGRARSTCATSSTT